MLCCNHSTRARRALIAHAFTACMHTYADHLHVTCYELRHSSRNNLQVNPRELLNSANQAPAATPPRTAAAAHTRFYPHHVARIEAVVVSKSHNVGGCSTHPQPHITLIAPPQRTRTPQPHPSSSTPPGPPWQCLPDASLHSCASGCTASNNASLRSCASKPAPAPSRLCSSRACCRRQRCRVPAMHDTLHT